jgi:hypothetical protein
LRCNQLRFVLQAIARRNIGDADGGDVMAHEARV